MNLGDLNTVLGAAASAIAIVTGAISIQAYIKNKDSKATSGGNKNSPPMSSKDRGTRSRNESSPSDNAPTILPTSRYFKNDDAAYRQWLQDHPKGFVVNTNAPPSANYFVLHKAGCGSIRPKSGSDDDNKMTGAYAKLCDVDRGVLQTYAQELGCQDGKFTATCGLCKP